MSPRGSNCKKQQGRGRKMRPRWFGEGPGVDGLDLRREKPGWGGCAAAGSWFDCQEGVAQLLASREAPCGWC